MDVRLHVSVGKKIESESLSIVWVVRNYCNAYRLIFAELIFLANSCKRPLEKFFPILMVILNFVSINFRDWGPLAKSVKICTHAIYVLNVP